MRLYLMRHGDAESGGPRRADRDRRLTPDGVAAVRAQARRFRTADVPPARVLTSPYVRAHSTATLVAETLGVPLETADALGCGASLGDMAQVVYPYADDAAVLLVGHQPDLGYAARALTGKVLRVHPGTVVAIDVDRVRDGGGRLVDVWQPA